MIVSVGLGPKYQEKDQDYENHKCKIWYYQSIDLHNQFNSQFILLFISCINLHKTWKRKSTHTKKIQPQNCTELRLLKHTHNYTDTNIIS